ncbi:MAG TPA: hypothetical protein VFT64_10790 [Rickettsiales bacterium]|nr:hypothetical protein [Rickettsiales bacterium]
MSKRLSSILLFLLLAACSGQAANDVDHGLDAVEDNTAATWNKARSIAGFPERQPKPKTSNAQARYCYRALEDIICYGKPIPGQEDRLIAYQGSHGQTGYILPEHHTDENGIELPVLESSKVAVPPAVAGTEAAPAANRPKLKEIFYNPDELQPRELVPQKSE